MHIRILSCPLSTSLVSYKLAEKLSPRQYDIFILAFASLFANTIILLFYEPLNCGYGEFDMFTHLGGRLDSRQCGNTMKSDSSLKLSSTRWP